jgi:hypothetical protein
VTQYLPIRRKDIQGWVIELLDGINGELRCMDTLIQAVREKIFVIQTALPGLAKDYKGFMIRQNEI